MPKTQLKGADYIATRRLSDIDDNTLADIGDTCERVPAVSMASLVKQGWIKKRPSKKTTKKKG